MNPKKLAAEVIQSLSTHPLLNVAFGSPVFVSGSDLDILRMHLIEKHNESSIDHAGVYIIGSDEDVLRIGEGGKGKRGGGTMGHRVFRHIDEKDWMTEAREIVFLPINPPEFSRLAEQTAFAIYFQQHNVLPRYNPDWR